MIRNDTDLNSAERGSVAGSLLPVGVALAGVAVLSYFILDRMSGFDERLQAVDARVEAIARESASAAEAAQSAARGSEDAARLAEAARENARAAAQGRAEAESAAAASAEETAEARAELARIQAEREQEMARLERALDQVAETQRTALGLVMNLGSDAIEFEFDQAELNPEDRELLSRIAGVLLTSSDYAIYVYGHTDDVGSDEYNQSLSERRALAVRDYMVDAGVDPEIITTRGYGKSSPLVQGTDPAARATNRRVEIGIVDVTFQYRGAEAP